MKRVLVLAVLLCMSTWAAAQKADIAGVVGGAFASDTDGTLQILPLGSTLATIKTDPHLFYEAAIGVRLLNAHLVSLHAEFVAAGVPSALVSIARLPDATDHLSSVFITPGIRVKFAPGAAISPWASVGGGWAHYTLDTDRSTSSKGALQFGGGLDFKTGLPRLGFRTELRDFITGNPSSAFQNLFSANTGFHRHNVLIGGGIVLRL